MANVDGKYDIPAWNMPVLVVIMIRKKLAILGFSVLASTLWSFVSHAAQMIANINLIATNSTVLSPIRGASNLKGAMMPA